jgi:hypothetical protein
MIWKMNLPESSHFCVPTGKLYRGEMSFLGSAVLTTELFLRRPDKKCGVHFMSTSHFLNSGNKLTPQTLTLPQMAPNVIEAKYGSKRLYGELRL